MELDLIGTTNDVLPPALQQQIKDLLSDTQADLNHLDVEIADAQSVLDGLLARRKTHVVQMQKYRIALAPEKKLPPEIFTKVFFFYHFADDVKVDMFHPKSGDPFLLGQICSRWRAVALATSELWSNVVIYFNSAHHTVSLVEAAQNFVVRGGLTHLSMHLNVDESAIDTQDERFVDPITTILLPNVHRLKNLRLRAPATMMKPFFELPLGSIDFLEAAYFDFKANGNRGDSFRNMEVDSITAFERAQCLRCVTFATDNLVLDDPRIFRFPWSSLTDLHFRNTFIDVTVCHTVLRECVYLVNCTVGIIPTHNGPTNTPDTLLPRLLSLTINAGHTPIYYGGFLNPFIVPSLQTCCIDSRPTRTHWAHLEFLAMAARSSFTLTHFTTRTAIPASLLSSVLQTMPLLQELDIAHVHFAIDPSTVKMFVRGELVPKLSILKCGVPQSVAPLFEMLASRTLGCGLEDALSGVVPLSSVTINHSSPMALKWQYKFETLREKGLRVYFSSQSPGYMDHLAYLRGTFV